MFWNKKTDITLEWGWDSDAKPDYSLIVEIHSAKLDKKRMFGGNNYRYIAGTVDQGVTITGVISENDTFSGKSLTLRLPDDELENIAIGEKLKLDIIDDSICIKASRV